MFEGAGNWNTLFAEVIFVYWWQLYTCAENQFLAESNPTRVLTYLVECVFFALAVSSSEEPSAQVDMMQTGGIMAHWWHVDATPSTSSERDAAISGIGKRPRDDGRTYVPTKPKIPLVASRHNTTRYLTHAFWHRKKLWCAVMLGTAWRDTLVTTRATLVRGVITAWTGVDMSTSLLPEVVSDVDANWVLKRLNANTAFSSSAMLEQARHNTLVTTRMTCRACRVVTSCDVMQQVEFGLNWLS